jgi:hypothetical protein
MAGAADHHRIDALTGFGKVAVRRYREVVATAGNRLLRIRAQSKRVDI